MEEWASAAELAELFPEQNWDKPYSDTVRGTLRRGIEHGIIRRDTAQRSVLAGCKRTPRMENVWVYNIADVRTYLDNSRKQKLANS